MRGSWKGVALLRLCNSSKVEAAASSSWEEAKSQAPGPQIGLDLAAAGPDPMQGARHLRTNYTAAALPLARCLGRQVEVGCLHRQKKVRARAAKHRGGSRGLWEAMTLNFRSSTDQAPTRQVARLPIGKTARGSRSTTSCSKRAALLLSQQLTVGRQQPTAKERPTVREHGSQEIAPQRPPTRQARALQAQDLMTLALSVPSHQSPCHRRRRLRRRCLLGLL
jgi:hypothetical protein